MREQHSLPRDNQIVTKNRNQMQTPFGFPRTILLAQDSNDLRKALFVVLDRS